jgi:hypothetical protein
MTDLGFLFPLAGAAVIGAAVWAVWPRHGFKRGGVLKPAGTITVTPQDKEELRRIRDCAEINAGRCPDCGASGSLCEGPSGGMSQNIACDQCLMEFNVGFGFGTGAFLVDRTGKLSRSRGRVFGFSDADFEGKEVAA